jgi:hypothetical protein
LADSGTINERLSFGTIQGVSRKRYPCDWNIEILDKGSAKTLFTDYDPGEIRINLTFPEAIDVN